MASLNLVEASIEEIQAALSSGALTSVELVARYLCRIARYDCRGYALNSIPILNNDVFGEAAESDDRRAAGLVTRRLEGIPYTVKDSYKVKGMTVASGSPAFKDLIANEDAFTVATIRAEGGILLGRTNMPPMAYGGMQRGVYGRAESPYNPNFLAAAWASGSSNGSAVSTAASFAAFGMGEETVSSGRSPASNNALVAYTPSRGWISIRGNWPLYPTCDVVVPHTRTMDDMLTLLEVITAKDPISQGDFWRDQPFTKLTEPWGGSAGSKSFRDIATFTSLAGLRIAVPNMYIGGPVPQGATPVFTNDAVKRLWDNSRKQLEELGAEIVIVPDFPVVTAYENPSLLPEGSSRLPEDWPWYERGPLVAHGWDTFLRVNADPHYPSLRSVNEFEIFPHSMRTQAELEHLPMSNGIHWGKLAGYTEKTSFYDVDSLDSAVVTLEELRKILLDDYLEQLNCHCFVFPSQGDVAAADSDVNPKTAAHAWKNGVFYSNGNRALRHLGIPSVTVPMGVIEDKGMPVGLTFAGRAYEDENLLKWANAFEKKTRLRTAPAYTPSLPSDIIQLVDLPLGGTRAKRPVLRVDKCTSVMSDPGSTRIQFEGTLRKSTDGKGEVWVPQLQCTVNGKDVPSEQIEIDVVDGVDSNSDNDSTIFRGWVLTPKPLDRDQREKTILPVARDKTMVVILARAAPGGYSSGYLNLI
ncbi:amidase signature domain-containing protein [Truncatella angustata]|uniref:Amidase signature domain-containing protein n=1 Tax=Truncatella angustata TaxID=152316 RepID=A0A9P8UD89_9PEZI|nr:amidase signature domain-containing protein [Truncatella angustata]KAH6647873.1 amidase signature domain-containing protein [Truncatella angustata]